MINVDQQINAVERAIGTRTLSAGQARTLTISQTYDATIDDVWDACTNPERLPRWFLPVTGDLQPGGHYQLQDNAHGTIETCQPPTGFDATWEFFGEVSWIEVRLAETQDGTALTLAHIAYVDDERWAEFGPGAVGVGWDLTVLGLALHLTAGAGVARMDSEVWSASDEGREFMSMSSGRWRDASIAAGSDAAGAAAAAERTTAFYTGVPAQDATAT
jgi:uncharacterized protein YndB with AHSA1/START domain